MKSLVAMSIVIFALPVYASGITVKISNADAKALYQSLVGKAVDQEGAAGHVYRQGKNIVCIRTNADMDDRQGKPVPNDDVRRYVCRIHIDSNGIATPGNA